MGYRNAMERIIKCIPVFLILILGFVMRCELFHTELGSVFASYPAIYCNVEENRFDSFIQDLEQDAQASDVSCFLPAGKRNRGFGKNLSYLQMMKT